MHLTAGRGVSSTVKAIAVASVVLLATCSDPFGPTVHEEILPSQQLQHGFKTTCLLNAAGEAVCWGETGGVFTPPSDTPAGFVALSVGSATCGLTQDGRAFCWGANSEGAVGDGTQTRRTTPTAVATEERFVTIRAGSRGTCALTGKGRAFCWGDNLRGSLGNGRMGSRERSLTPIPVSTSRPFKELGGMGPLKCGLGQDGRAFCWGTIGGTFGEDFQVQGDCDDFYYVWFTGRQCLTPTPVAGDRSFSQIVSGVTQCALTDGGDAFCWEWRLRYQHACVRAREGEGRLDVSGPRGGRTTHVRPDRRGRRLLLGEQLRGTARDRLGRSRRWSDPHRRGAGPGRRRPPFFGAVRPWLWNLRTEGERGGLVLGQRKSRAG